MESETINKITELPKRIAPALANELCVINKR